MAQRHRQGRNSEAVDGARAATSTTIGPALSAAIVQVRGDDVAFREGRMADEPQLKIAIADYGHTRALKSGEVRIRGVKPDFVQVAPIIGAFRRMVRDVEFDVCEMAPTTYMIARALGAPFIAIPVFVMRRFHHSGFVVRPDSASRSQRTSRAKGSACAPIRSPPECGPAASSSTNTGWTRAK
jgi:hypothetical protein